MKPALARLLIRLYPRYWRERYGEEFYALLADRTGDLHTSANVVWSALCERVFPTPGLKIGRDSCVFQFQSWCDRAPWVMFGLAPLFLLAAAYLVACLILWSGWRIFLPQSASPFVPLDGYAIAYFGAGRFLYYAAPILIGWAIVLIAAHQDSKAIWPTVGLVLIALTGGTAQVHASRPTVPGGLGHISMDFHLGTSDQVIASGLFRALIILSLTVVPYLLWRLRKGHSLFL